MTFVNSYKPPQDNDAFDGTFQDPYDLNSEIPLPSLLETPRVQLVPFIPALHAENFFNAFAPDADVIQKYLPVLEWQDMKTFLVFLESAIRRRASSALFVIIDKTKPSTDKNIPAGRVAGIIGWMYGSYKNLFCEIGPVLILPEFQRTFVSANAIGLLQKYLLDVPADGGLGFRRLAWCTDPFNVGSMAAAEKMGFIKEGTMRWLWVLPAGKVGKPVGEGRGEGDGRDSVLLSLCWDDWVSGVRDMVVKRMERV